MISEKQMVARLNKRMKKYSREGCEHEDKYRISTNEKINQHIEEVMAFEKSHYLTSIPNSTFKIDFACFFRLTQAVIFEEQRYWVYHYKGLKNKNKMMVFRNGRKISNQSFYKIQRKITEKDRKNFPYDHDKVQGGIRVYMGGTTFLYTCNETESSVEIKLICEYPDIFEREIKGEQVLLGTILYFSILYSKEIRLELSEVSDLIVVKESDLWKIGFNNKNGIWVKGDDAND